MRRYQAECDDCGPIAPVRVRRGVADRDVRKHDCASFEPADQPTVGERRVDDPLGLMRIARAVASETVKRLPRLACDYDDILSDAALGVAKAIERHDPTRGSTLTTYAMMRARHEVQDGIRDRGLLTRHELARGVQLGDLPAHRHTPASIEAHRDDWGADLPVPDPTGTAGYDAVDARLTLPVALATLKPNERHVLEQTYLHDRKLLDIAGDLGVTESRVCQLHKAALARARQHLAAA